MAHLPEEPFKPMAEGMRGLTEVFDRLLGIDQIERTVDEAVEPFQELLRESFNRQRNARLNAELMAEPDPDGYFPEPTAPEIR